ncbi:MAG TPA: hypothetical protein VJ746_03640 [Nitrospira sp.]|nr:hypothetical protein [Nitrospira sp.]
MMTALILPSRRRFLLSLLLPLIPTLWSPASTSAEVRVVSSHGEHRMGDRDTREDAVRLATEAAKRDALEQVATYLEGVTVVEGTDVTKDEIRTYTAGLVLVLDQRTNLALDGDTVVVHVDLTSQVDTEEVAQAIVALRENEDARHQLTALRLENDQLQRELDSANQALAVASSTDQVQQASQQRQDILNRVQSNAMVAQAWTDWVIVSPVVSPYPWVGIAQTQALLNEARGLYPTSPHVQVAQQVMTTKQPPAPPQPPSPPAPGSAPRMPSYQIVPGPSSLPIPKTLNEVTQHSAVPPQIGNQPGLGSGSPVPASRTMTDVRQPNPLLPSPNGTSPSQTMQQPGSRSVQSLHQFLQPPATVPPNGQPPVARYLPPTINQIHPPVPHHVPRVPYQMVPRYYGSGGHYGGGGHGGGHGGGGRGR